MDYDYWIYYKLLFFLGMGRLVCPGIFSSVSVEVEENVARSNPDHDCEDESMSNLLGQWDSVTGHTRHPCGMGESPRGHRGPHSHGGFHNHTACNLSQHFSKNSRLHRMKFPTKEVETSLKMAADWTKAALVSRNSSSTSNLVERKDRGRTTQRHKDIVEMCFRCPRHLLHFFRANI